MVRRSRIDLQMLSFRSKKEKKRTIIVGLKSDNYSREILLRLLTLVVKPEDNVVAIHVQSSQDIFDPNTFHIHEDLCKSKKVFHFYPFSFSFKIIITKTGVFIWQAYLCRLNSKLRSVLGIHMFLY